MSMDIEKLRAVGQDVEQHKQKSNIAPKVLAIVKKATKDGKSLTQKEVSTILGEKIGRTVAPQHVRSVLLSLRKKGAVKRLISRVPDEGGNTHFWFTPK